MNISNIGTFYFLSLGILFILCCLLVYHFKRRLDLFEQKNDTIFEIVNNVLTEISSIKQKQNVLFMLAKSMPPTEGGSVENKATLDNASNPIDLCTRVVETNIHNNIKNKNKKAYNNEEDYEDEYEDEDKNEHEDEYEDEDVDEDKNDDEYDDENEEDESVEDEDEEEKTNHMTHKYINYHPNTVVSSDIKKIKVVDDDEKTIDLTNNDNESEKSNELFTSHFNNIYTKNEVDNERHSSILDIDMKMLNLHSLHQLHSNLFHNNIQFDNTDLNIQILNDVDKVNDLNNIVEILDDNNDIYKDMPELETIEDNLINNSINNLKKHSDIDIDESQLVENLTDNYTHVKDDSNVNKENCSEIEFDSLTESEHKEVVNKLLFTETTDETMSIISEDEFNFKKSEKLGGYRKLSVQALRELVVSKGLIQDASKLKKGEILVLLQNAL